MGLKESAPLLSKLWPYAITLGGGAAVIGLLRALSSRTGNKRVRFAGRPLDEDNYVFRDSAGDEDCDDGEVYEEDEDRGEETPQVPYSIERYSHEQMVTRSTQFATLMNSRRTVRFFSSEPVPHDVICNVIKAAGTAPSGAHTEPWTFVVVSNQEVKRQIRAIIEEEEELNYRRRMGEKWVADLAKLKTSWNKPYLEEAPYLVIVFKQVYGIKANGAKKTHYYSEISTSIAVGIFLAALTSVGLTTVTSTPMNAGPQLRILLNRPVNEKVLVLLPVGYPAHNATVPQLYRKPLEEIMINV